MFYILYSRFAFVCLTMLCVHLTIKGKLLTYLLTWPRNFIFWCAHTSSEYLGHVCMSRSSFQGQGHRSKKGCMSITKYTHYHCILHCTIQPTGCKIYNKLLTYVVVTCKRKLFQNYIYFSLCRRPSEIILFQRVETCLKLFQNYLAGLLQLMNIFQHVHCHWNNFEVVLELL